MRFAICWRSMSIRRRCCPPDDESYGFDNIADVLKTSPSLLERYMSASWNISRLAVGDPSIGATSAIYRARADLSQNEHLDGLPLGTRGGISVQAQFSAGWRIHD